MEWIALNWYWLAPLAATIGGGVLGALKVAAKKTPSVYDDKIVTMLSGLFDQLRGGKKG